MTDGAAEVDPRRRRHDAARRGARQGRPRRAGAEDARGGLEDALGGGKRRRGKEDLRGGLHDARRSNSGDDGQAGLGPAGRRGQPLGKVREGRLWSEGRGGWGSRSLHCLRRNLKIAPLIQLGAAFRVQHYETCFKKSKISKR